MKKLSYTSALVALLALFAISTTPIHAQDHDAMIAAANALDMAFVDAVNSGDAEALSATYWDSPDVVSFPPDAMQALGIDAVKAGNKAFVASLTGAKLELHDGHDMVAGDVVISWGLFTMTIPTPDGGTVEMSGRYTDVKAERDGKWVYLLDHASVPLPPAPPAPEGGGY